MNADDLAELIRKYLSTGIAVVMILVAPGTHAATAATAPPVSTTPPAAPGGTTGPPTGTGTGNADDGTGSITDTGSGTAAGSRSGTATAGSDPDSGTGSNPDSGSAPRSGTGSNPDSGSDSGAGSGTGSDAGSDSGSAAADNGSAQGGSTGDGAGSGERSGTAAPGATAEGTTAAAKYGWGTPNREDDFSGGSDQWSIYDGPGHAGKGTRSRSALSIHDGVLTITGDSAGTTAGMAWNPGQKYGRWEGRVRAPASDPSYDAVMLLWPDAEDFPKGGEVDFMEMRDSTRQTTDIFVHHGADNAQAHGSVHVDATQWHDWAVEWTPQGITAYVDGTPWYHTADTAVLPPGPMHLCIQLDWFPTDSGTPKQSTMQVDWVRQYGLDGETRPTGSASSATGSADTTATPGTAASADRGAESDQGAALRGLIRRILGGA